MAFVSCDAEGEKSKSLPSLREWETFVGLQLSDYDLGNTSQYTVHLFACFSLGEREGEAGV